MVDATPESAYPRRSPEDHERFLLDLRDVLRNEADTNTILAETTERLARHFGASRTGYGEVDENLETFFVRKNWVDGSVVSLDTPMPFAIFGEVITSGLKRGETWVHEDLDDPKLDDAGRRICIELGMMAVITVPLVKNGRFVALLSVQQSQPRRWHPADIALVHEVADRTWVTIERARAEDGRRTSEDVLAAIMRHAPIGIYLKDLDGRYRLANDEMARVLGHRHDHVTGRTAGDLLDLATARAVAAADADAVASGLPSSCETQRAGAEVYEHSLSMRFPIAVNGRDRYLAGFEIDITALKRTEAELERSREALYQAEKISALGSLLAGVSHELNNPLSIIVAQAELLEMEAAGTPAAARAMAIRGAAERSARIVQAFLAMARQKRPNRTSVDLNDVVRAATDLLAYGLRSNGIAVRQRLNPDLPSLRADADQLHQVVVNLVINAQQAMADWSGERALTISTDTNAGRGTVRLIVADSGPGIPADLRRRIFEPFFTTKVQNEGTGVGLSFSQGIVEAHRGRLEILPSDTGAAFAMTLPIGDAGAPGDTPLAAVPPAAGSGRARTAIVIDDEPQLAGALADILTHLGFSVTEVHSGAAAQAVLKTANPDLIVSDLRMPDIDGAQLFAWLTAARPDLVGAVAFSTGDTLSTAAARFLKEAERPFMEKPFTLSTVRRLVDSVADRNTGAVDAPTRDAAA